MARIRHKHSEYYSSHTLRCLQSKRWEILVDRRNCFSQIAGGNAKWCVHPLWKIVSSSLNYYISQQFTPKELKISTYTQICNWMFISATTGWIASPIHILKPNSQCSRRKRLVLWNWKKTLKTLFILSTIYKAQAVSPYQTQICKCTNLELHSLQKCKHCYL